jgi:nitronate monooxygenase
MLGPGDLRLPIVQAPMAGGPSTPDLAIAVANAGGLGFLAAGYKQSDAVRAEIAAVRAGTSEPFGLNIFMPSSAPAEPAVLAAYLERIAPEAERQGVALGEPRFDDDGFEGKLEVVCDEGVPLASFTFGCPDRATIERLHAAGAAVWVTVTKRAEALQAQAAGADALVLQGTEAGGHRGSFVDDGFPGIGILALTRVLASATALPLIASGGIADGGALAAVLCAGAAAGQIGTALLLAPEAGTNDAQRALVGTDAPTDLTRAFSGRLARGIVNRFMTAHSAQAPSAYPEINAATGPLRAAARKAADAGSFNLWAGQAHGLTRARPAAETVTRMAAGARVRLDAAGARLERC